MEDKRKHTRSSLTAYPLATTGTTPTDVNELMTKPTTNKRKRKTTAKAKETNDNIPPTTVDENKTTRVEDDIDTDTNEDTLAKGQTDDETDDIDIIDIDPTNPEAVRQALARMKYEKEITERRAFERARVQLQQDRIADGIARRAARLHSLQVRQQVARDKQVAEELAQRIQDQDTTSAHDVAAEERRVVAEALASYRQTKKGPTSSSSSPSASSPGASKIPDVQITGTSPNLEIISEVKNMMSQITRQHIAKSAEVTTKWAATKCHMRTSALLRVLGAVKSSSECANAPTSLLCHTHIYVARVCMCVYMPIELVSLYILDGTGSPTNTHVNASPLTPPSHPISDESFPNARRLGVCMIHRLMYPNEISL